MRMVEKLMCVICLQIFSHKDHEDFFGVTSKNGFSFVFLQTLGTIFRSQTTLVVNFARILRDFAQIFRGFARIFDKSKRLGVRLHFRLP